MMVSDNLRELLDEIERLDYPYHEQEGNHMSTVEQKPSIGRIVHYTLTEHDCARIDNERTAYEQRRGNAVSVGDTFPMEIVRVWASDSLDLTPDTAVNGQVKLDGNDTLWVTSVTLGDGPGHFVWPGRV